MSVSTILKWLAAVGVAGVLAALQAISVAIGTPVTGLNPLIQAVIVAVVAKLVTWLTSKLPINA